MIVVTKGAVNHNGQRYMHGEVIADMSRKEEERLINLGVAQAVLTYSAPVAAAPAPSFVPVTDKDGKLPDYNDDMTLAQLKDAAAAYDVDAGTMRAKAEVIAAINAKIELDRANSEKVDLNFNPDDLIKTGK